METENVAPTEVPEGAYLIDVREQGEWDAGHAPDAHHLPASSLLENLDKLPEDDQDLYIVCRTGGRCTDPGRPRRSEEHTSELQSRGHLVCRLLLEKKKKHQTLLAEATRSA